MEKKIQLNELLKIKENLEESIKRDDQLIQRNNSIIATNERLVDVGEIEKTRELKEKQLVGLKEAIQKANMENHSGEKNSNFYYIYTLSNLKRLKLFYTRLHTTDGKKERGKDIIEYSAIIKHDEVDKKIREIDHQIQIIEIKLTKFNNNTNVKVEFFSELNLT